MEPKRPWLLQSNFIRVSLISLSYSDNNVYSIFFQERYLWTAYRRTTTTKRLFVSFLPEEGPIDTTLNLSLITAR